MKEGGTKGDEQREWMEGGRRRWAKVGEDDVKLKGTRKRDGEGTADTDTSGDDQGGECVTKEKAQGI